MDYPKPASFRTLDDFRAHLAASNIPICLAELPPAGESALAKPLNSLTLKPLDFHSPVCVAGPLPWGTPHPLKNLTCPLF